MNRKTFGSTALVLALLLAVTTLGFSPAALASGDERTGRLSVSGVGAVEVAPDQATVRIRLSHLRDGGGRGAGRKRCRPAGLAGSAGCFGYHRRRPEDTGSQLA